MAKKRGEMLEQTEIKIPFEHLSPAAQAVIGENNIPRTVKGGRFVRGACELAPPFAFSVWLSFAHASKLSPEVMHGLLPVSLAAGTLSSMSIRTVASKEIQQAHEELKRVINKHGALSTEFEGHYPFNWINPTQIARTHPVFYVTGRGDVVFNRHIIPPV